MLNLLIANKNLQNLQNLQNCISQYVPDVRVGYIATDGKVTLEVLNQKHYDIALIDSNLPIYDGFEVLQKLATAKPSEYKNSIIFLASNQDVITKLKKNNELIYDAFLNDDNAFNSIISCLRRLAKSQEQKSEISCIRNKIINELQNIGFNLAHKGTHYLAESVVLIVTLNCNADNLSRNIYPKVSQIFNRDLNNIKCNITSATEAACKKLTKETWDKYFKMSERVKPTTKMIIYSVLQRL